MQRQLLRWAADTLGELPADRLPATLRSVARFRAGRRASLGAAALVTALDGDNAFRAAVAEHVRGAAVDWSTEGDLVARAAAAQLWDLPTAAQLLDEAATSDERGALRREIERLTGELAASAPRSGPGSSRPRPGDTGDSDQPDKAALDRLRQRLRDQGSALRAARDDAAAADERATAELKLLRVAHERLQAELRNARERLDQEQTRADRAQQQLSILRAEDRSGREAAHRRVELLLDTVERAGLGLRREWQLTVGGPDPADRVAASLAAPVAPLTGDTTTLNGLLALPHAHLIVDGYNVTKTGYQQLTLAEQRDRLVRELAAVVTRTSTEITVVFDGAAVVVPQARFRGVRVLYSPAGVSADDVIRRLVAAEPVGRVLLVVTADREIIQSVVRSGARSVSPTLLLSAIQQDGRLHPRS